MLIFLGELFENFLPIVGIGFDGLKADLQGVKAVLLDWGFALTA
tara:strand:- start:2932 stop:3063 length:132 start_codon:yes stop_codon:yes gene_type:complete